MGLVSPVARGGAAGAPGASRSGGKDDKRTMAGIAVPGVAPTHSKARAPAPVFVAPPPPPAALDASSASSASSAGDAYDGSGDEGVRPTLPPRGAPSRTPFIALAVALVIGAIVLVIVFRRSAPPPQITVASAPEDEGVLVIGCGTCRDGAEIVRGDDHAAFVGGKARISLATKDLVVGSNKVAVTLVDGDKRWPLTLDINVPYRARLDLAPLAAGKSEVAVAFDVSADVTKITLEDGTVAKMKEGSARAAVAVPAPVDGEAHSFDRLVAFTVELGEGDARKGTLKLSIPYASLKIALPGRAAVLVGTAPLSVSGHTAPHAKVRLGEGAGEVELYADAGGIFRGTITPAEGATEIAVQAFGAAIAPRKATIAFTRKKTLAIAFTDFGAWAKGSFLELAKKPDDHVGEWAHFKLTTVKVGDEDGRTVVVGDVKCGNGNGNDDGVKCPVAKVLWPPTGIAAAPTEGALVEIVGVVTRSIALDGGKTTATELDAALAKVVK